MPLTFAYQPRHTPRPGKLAYLFRKGDLKRRYSASSLGNYIALWEAKAAALSPDRAEGQRDDEGELLDLQVCS